MNFFSSRLSNQAGAHFAKTLDALQACVMLVDESLTITYVNSALSRMMQDAAAELRRDLPHFNAATLVGANMDIFHKSPSHQRQILTTLTGPHATSIAIGPRVFDVVITPVMANKRRTGFVIEWVDARERLQNANYIGTMQALSRTQAIIEFDTDGIILDANDKFLQTMGYRLDEIKGQHHSLFVDPQTRQSQDYRDFWAELRHGQFRAAQFRRIAKGGREVWISGAYNPVLDPSGGVRKIVKFAIDITAEARRMSELKRLIDQNFQEIDGAVAQSQAEGRSAASAAQETLARVQTVAAGTEQLAGSIAEIAGSMTRTQTSANAAFERAEAVGDSTTKLVAATQEMNGIVDLIRNIAGQINLLALNATIEAARAGDAGKGFAVVASEVKNLANQSANATTQISREIENIQATSADVARATETIRDAIRDVREYITSAASAVEEQNSVTTSIATDMQSAAETVATTSRGIDGVATAVLDVVDRVAKTKQAAMVLAR